MLKLTMPPSLVPLGWASPIRSAWQDRPQRLWAAIKLSGRNPRQNNRFWGRPSEAALTVGLLGAVFGRGAILIFVAILAGQEARAQAGRQQSSPRALVLQQARELLERGDISYTFGGSQAGNQDQCLACNRCLATESPRPKERLQSCPDCQTCSMDCSHFVMLVLVQAGLPTSYLTTSSMLSLPSRILRSVYHFIDLDRQVGRLLPGDLVVYPGHVVLVEKRHKNGKVDIIHATEGRDLKGPGLGIQRQRFVDLSQFKGPVQRILRHVKLANSDSGKLSNLRKIPHSPPQQ